MFTGAVDTTNDTFGGCQFFFTLSATPHLTGKYTRVGELENLDEAMKVLESLELGVVIERVRVL